MADDRKKPVIMLIGVGSLGAAILELASREPELGEIVVCSRDAERGFARCNGALLGSVAQGYTPSVRFAALDLNDQDQVAGTVARLRPDLIINTATMQPWWLVNLLPSEAAQPLRKARFGAWLAPNLALTLKLMRVLRATAYPGFTITAPFPDVVNCILGRLGLAAECGVGNLDEIAAKMRLLAAEKLNQRLDSIRVVLVAHHALEATAFDGMVQRVPPYFLRIFCMNEDVTATVDAPGLLHTSFPLPSGQASSFITAGSALRLLRALVSDGETLMHAPSPHGLPGGYPVIVRRGSVERAPVAQLSPAAAIDINERSHAFDGIERIESDGTAVFCAEDAGILREVLGYDCDRLRPEDSEPRAHELMARFREYGRKSGVDVDRLARSLA